MMRTTLLSAVILLLTALAAWPTRAQESCTRLSIYFTASEKTTLDGKLGVWYEQTGGGKFGFADFWMDEEEIASGKKFLVGAFNIVGVSAYSVHMNEDELDIDGDGKFTTSTSDCSGPRPISDGRLNLDDPASLAIVYTNSKTKGFDVYQVNPTTGSGDLVIRATRAEIDAAHAAATAPGGVNTLIASSGPVSLWALTSGECQRNSFYLDGKPDVFIFDCGSQAG